MTFYPDQITAYADEIPFDSPLAEDVAQEVEQSAIAEAHDISSQLEIIKTAVQQSDSLAIIDAKDEMLLKLGGLLGAVEQLHNAELISFAQDAIAYVEDATNYALGMTNTAIAAVTIGDALQTRRNEAITEHAYLEHAVQTQDTSNPLVNGLVTAVANDTIADVATAAFETAISDAYKCLGVGLALYLQIDEKEVYALFRKVEHVYAAYEDEAGAVGHRDDEGIDLSDYTRRELALSMRVAGQELLTCEQERRDRIAREVAAFDAKYRK